MAATCRQEWLTIERNFIFFDIQDLLCLSIGSVVFNARISLAGAGAHRTQPVALWDTAPAPTREIR